jgi:excinuclease UvrABC helicase subunit UvrB
MRTGADIDRDECVMGVGVALLGEGLDVPGAVLVAVIHDPSFLVLAVGGHPLASAN